MAYKTIYNPGDFKKFIEIQSFDKRVNEMGIATEDWKTILKLRTFPRNNLSTSKMEYYRAMGINSTNIKEFIIRYHAEINAKCRVVYEGKAYDVFKVDDIDEESKYQKISARLVE